MWVVVEAVEDIGRRYPAFAYASECLYDFTFRAVLQVGRDVYLYGRRVWKVKVFPDEEEEVAEVLQAFVDVLWH